VPGKEDKDRPCFTVMKMIRKLFNVIEWSVLTLQKAIKEIKFNLLGQRDPFNSLFLFPHAREAFL
jgi:hypothetical protein